MEIKECMIMAIFYTVSFCVEFSLLVLGTIAFYMLGWTAIAVLSTIITSVLFVGCLYFLMVFALHDATN